MATYGIGEAFINSPDKLCPPPIFARSTTIINMNGTTDYMEPWVQVAATTPTCLWQQPPNGLDHLSTSGHDHDRISR